MKYSWLEVGVKDERKKKVDRKEKLKEKVWRPASSVVVLLVGFVDEWKAQLCGAELNT